MCVCVCQAVQTEEQAEDLGVCCLQAAVQHDAGVQGHGAVHGQHDHWLGQQGEAPCVCGGGGRGVGVCDTHVPVCVTMCVCNCGEGCLCRLCVMCMWGVWNGWTMCACVASGGGGGGG